jgi:hypothetical protein
VTTKTVFVVVCREGKRLKEKGGDGLEKRRRWKKKG